MTRKSKKIGRPEIYSENLAEMVLAHFANGGTIQKMNADPALPVWDTVRRWKRDRPEFSSRYTRAREDAADFVADEGLKAAREASDKDNSAAARVKLEGAKWFSSVMNPKRFAPQPAHQALSVSVGLIGVLEVVEERRRALKDVTPAPKEIEGDASLEIGVESKENGDDRSGDIPDID